MRTILTRAFDWPSSSGDVFAWTIILSFHIASESLNPPAFARARGKGLPSIYIPLPLWQTSSSIRFKCRIGLPEILACHSS
jgi:hypothetical protein